MADRGALGDGIDAKITVPIFPRHPSATVSAIRANNSSSPMNPSPLRETSLAGAIEEMAIEDTPETTPVDTAKTKHKLADISEDMTPPESIKAEPPFIIDGSQSHEVKGPGCLSSKNAHEPSTSDFNIDHRGMDDPFISPTPKHTTQIGSMLTPSQNIIAARIQSSIAVPCGNGFSPRPDRLGQQITAANAQGVLPPEALVFVANLSNQRSDDQLEISCHQAFDTFGKCHVKIKRDRNNQPYAFVQFEQIGDADLAVKEARGVKIDGRCCRTEHAKAARAVVLVRLSGGQITEAEARAIMGPFGAIAEVSPVTIRDQQELGMPSAGLWIKFAFFQDCKDAIWNFKHSEHYRVHIPPSDVKPVPPFNNTSPASGFGLRSPSDERSIFLGGLPEEVHDEQLRHILAHFGTINTVSIMRKLGPHGGLNIFAFVEFRHPEEAAAAINAEVMIGDNKIRVERKEYTQRRNARLLAAAAAASPSPTPYPQPPTPPGPGIAQAIYNYALDLGLTPQDASPILSIGRSNPFDGRYRPRAVFGPFGEYGSPGYMG